MRPVLAMVMASLIAITGCATWQRQIETAAQAGHITAAETWRTVRPILHTRCMAAAMLCARDGTPAMARCAPWAQCDAQRKAVTAAIYSIHDLSARAVEAARASRRDSAERIVAAITSALRALAGIAGAIKAGRVEP